MGNKNPIAATTYSSTPRSLPVGQLWAAATNLTLTLGEIEFGENVVVADLEQGQTATFESVFASAALGQVP